MKTKNFKEILEKEELKMSDLNEKVIGLQREMDVSRISMMEIKGRISMLKDLMKEKEDGSNT